MIRVLINSWFYVQSKVCDFYHDPPHVLKLEQMCKQYWEGMSILEYVRLSKMEVGLSHTKTH